MLKYAVDAGFLNHSGRTVFEQMLVRMGSRTAPLDYFDITPEGVARRCATEVAEGVRSAARALRALGVGPQDRVALVGVNSTRYFAADAARTSAESRLGQLSAADRGICPHERGAHALLSKLGN